MEPFDITMTATLRPGLIRKTLESFNKNLFKEHVEKGRLIINIDMVGSPGINSTVAEINKILDDQPFCKKTVRIGTDPNFAQAWQWCMSQTRAKYIFNLEEDWELLISLDFERMVDLMENTPYLAHLRLSQFKSTAESIKAWQNHAHWNGQFFEYDDRIKQIDGWAGHPSINCRAFMDCVQLYMDPSANPEKQIKGSWGPQIEGLISQHRFGIYHPQNQGPAIRDLGREWMAENGYRKAGSKAWFTKWEKESA